MTLRPAQLLRGLAVVLAVALWAVLAHFSSDGSTSSNWAVLLAVSPVAAALILMCWRTRHPLWTGLGVVGLLGVLVASLPFLRQNVALLYFLQHLGANLAFGALFGRSLLGNGDALITQMAHAVHPEGLTEIKRRYTRQITGAWTIFFLANALISVLLYFLAPLTVWSVFANLLSMPLLIAMFVGEHLWRVHTLPPEERPTIQQVIRAYRMHRGGIPPGNPT